MPHENIDVACFHVLIRPYHRMVSHLDRCLRRIGVLIDTRQNMHTESGSASCSKVSPRLGSENMVSVCLNLTGVTVYGPRSGTGHGVVPTTTMLSSFLDHCKVGRSGWPKARGAGGVCGCRGHGVRGARWEDQECRQNARRGLRLKKSLASHTS